MTWIEGSQYANIVLGIALGLRVHRLKLPGVYSIFVAFVLFDILQSVVYIVIRLSHTTRIDYRWVWMGERLIAWMLALWMVYALLTAILRKLPGISRLSRALFKSVFALATSVSLFTAIPEYTQMGASDRPLVDQALLFALALDRAISMCAVLVLLLMLAFILWFPVQMPRNLAVFSIGLVIFFGAKTILLPIRAYLPHFFNNHSALLSMASGLVLMACFAYWILFISARGEAMDVRIGHSWGAEGQLRMIGQLEAMNAALLRAGNSA